MSVNVYTYDNPLTLFQQNKLDLNCTIHICATSNMAEAIRNQIKTKNIKSLVLSMKQFNEIIFKDWFSDEIILAQYLELTDYLDKINISDKTLLQTYKRNKDELLDTLRLLYFSDTNPNNISDILKANNFSKKEELLPILYLWFYNLNNNKSFLDSSHFEKSNLIRTLEEENNIQLSSRIIFHGFYFITPEQQKIMELVKKNGFEINFLHYYKYNYPSSFSFIQKFINEDYGWLDYQEWENITIDDNIYLSDVFSSMFEGNELINTNPKLIERYEYSNFTDFLTHAERYNYLDKKEKVIMATNSKYMNNRMQEFYPEKYRSYRNFLKYPIGHLLVLLHEMWDSEEKKLKADNDHIMNILFSGYFFLEEGEEILGAVFKEIYIFFNNCQTRVEWEKQFKKLLDIRLLIEENYQIASGKVDKFHPEFSSDVNESPFSYLPYLSVSSDNIKKVSTKVVAIFDLAKELFSADTEDINLKHHFEKMLNIVNDIRNIKNLDGKDKSILIDLAAKLGKNINIQEVNKDYLIEAINFYLAGSPNTDDEELIEPLINIDGELFRDRNIHITGLDELGLPYGEYNLPWPLSEELIEKLAIDNRYLRLLVYRNESVINMTRYILHIMYRQNDKIEISHIKNYERNSNLQHSFYIKLMDEYIKNEDNPTEIKLGFKEVIIKENKTYNVANYSIDKRAEFIHYPNRLLYSKASIQISYVSIFQQQFILSSLATFLLVNNDYTTVELFLKEIFPQFSSLFVELAIEKAKEFARRSRKQFMKNPKNIQVTDYRKLFIFPSFKWSNSNDNELNIREIYKQAEKVFEVTDHDFSKKLIYNSYIYPYNYIEYPKDYVGDYDE